MTHSRTTAFIGIAVLMIQLAISRADVRLNEFMARNSGAVIDPYGQNPDWIELCNTGTTSVDLTGFSVALDTNPTNRWPIPKGATLAAKGYLLIWCDSSLPASTQPGQVHNLGRALPGQGGQILLYNKPGQQVDAVDYGFQLEDVSVGRNSNSEWILLAAPSPAKTNGVAMDVGNVQDLKLNEWLANPASDSDWFEIHNAANKPVEIAGCLLSADPAQPVNAMFAVASRSWIDAGGWVLFYADKKTNSGKDHVSFSLDKQGGSLLLSTAQGGLIDRIDFGPQLSGISEGRLPDGTGRIEKFADTMSPGEANYLLITNLWVNEVLAHTDPPLEDAVEFYNPTLEPVDLGGWFLSNRESNPKKYKIPPGTVALPFGFVVLYENQFKGANDFTFNSAHGDTVILSAADAAGTLAGFRLKQKFGSSANGVSFGRFESTERVDFVPTQSLTFGVDTPASVADFRKGKGNGNSYPRTGPVVINEIMYHPPDAWSEGQTNEAKFEFIELKNITPAAVQFQDIEHPANTWRIEGEVDFQFPSEARLSAQGILLLVDFDPNNNAAALEIFRQKYPSLPAAALMLGPFKGKLSNGEGRICLLKPDSPQEPPHSDAGYVPYLYVDQVRYSDQSPWPFDADGGGQSLQRQVPGDYGDDVVNWRAGIPSPGQPNDLAAKDTDQDGMPDDWELAYSLNPAMDGDAGLDADLDGHINRMEYVAGTDPRNSNDCLCIESIREVDGLVQLSFQAQPGKTYTVLRCPIGARFHWERVIDLGARGNRWQPVIHDRLSDSMNGAHYQILTPHAFE